MQKYLPFIMYYGSALLLKYIVYKHLDCMLGHRNLLVYKISDLYIPLTVFETLGSKLKNKNKNDKNWRNGCFAISPKLIV